MPICSALPQNPFGNFTIKVASTGAYVTASSANTNLVASSSTSSSAASAATFVSGYVPNAGTLQLASTGQYVTADQSGNYTLAAARATASTWERFTIRQKVGAAQGVYAIKAASNGLYVTVGSDGGLINNGVDEAAGAGFRFVQV
jgi:endo-1,3(4)-beta-glucanase